MSFRIRHHLAISLLIAAIYSQTPASEPAVESSESVAIGRISDKEEDEPQEADDTPSPSEEDHVIHLDDSWISVPGELFHDVTMFQDVAPVPVGPQTFESSPASSLVSQDATARLFGDPASSRSLLSDNRRRLAHQPGTDIVFGTESRIRASTDAGSLLGRSTAGLGINVENRTPIITDPRVRGNGVGSLLASGSYWFPVRQDLDTVLSKIDSRIIDDMIVIKGPYSALYGPGFSFIDVQLLESPRYYDGFETHSSTSAEYKTNGQQFYGRETVWGGNDSYGFRIGYGHRIGNDYRDGSGIKYPSSYNSRDFDVALGVDLTDYSSLEFNYLRLDQTGVEIPGQVFDLDFVTTNAFELTYRREGGISDYFEAEGWYNQSYLGGNAQRVGKRQQMPILDATGFVGNLDANNNSTGTRLQWDWGEEGDTRKTLGADLRYLRQELNELDMATDPTFISPANTLINFPIPRALSANPGVFGEFETPLSSQLTVRGGGRLDWVHTNARSEVPLTLASMAIPPLTLEDTSLGKFNRNFDLASVFVTAEYELNETWTATGGAGYAMRAPTMSELYAQSPFMAVLPQYAFTSPFGNPNLRKERRTQVDLGAQGDYGDLRLGANAFHAWIQDYITLDFLTPVPGGAVFRYTNSPRASLTGFELYGEFDASSYVTAFGTMSFVEGRDLTRNQNGFFSPAQIPGFPPASTQPRSSAFDGTTLSTSTAEPMPVIAPLNSRIGIRLHDPDTDPLWGVEFLVRIVDNQDRVATSLGEQFTAGFTTLDIRGYAKATDKLNVFAGIENVTDRKYREYLDSRILINPVYQPGISFYFGTEYIY
ncbi:MAG: TonB-dependent receptor [Planctomycetaceae bacterium]|nr:TonB-dependent receptor [Planctomycetales bacterium]MCB9924116.1 TonB-dependent receptor [Planctomycetaceae bacterium]